MSEFYITIEEDKDEKDDFTILEKGLAAVCYS